MLKFMRDHLGRTFFFIIVGAISLVFVLWGVFPDSGMGGGVGASEVANVGGMRISAAEFRNAVNRDIEGYKALGMDLPPEMMENVKVGTLQNLVRNKLMLVEAKRLGILASDKEVMDEIQRMPYFQDKDKKTFNVDLYRKVLADNNLSPAQFEDSVRESLTNQRVVRFLEARIRVTPAEVAREFQVTNDTRNLTFVRFSREDAMKKMTVTPAQLEEFLNSKDADAQIRSFYATNNTKYNKQEQVCARHILKRAAPPTKGEDANKAPKAFTDLNPTPANFAQLASKHSEDPGSKENGGDLQCFPKGVMDSAFETAAFSLPVGKVSEPVKSQFGWHYIYVYKKNPAVNQPLEKVRNEIAMELIKRSRVDEIRKINVASAEAAMKSWPAKGAETTGAFNGLEGNIPKIGRADEIMKAAFDPQAKIQTGPQMFESQGGVIVAMVKEKKTADMAKLKQEEEVHARTLKERKLRAFLPAWLEDVQKRTKVSYNNRAIGNM